jgi:hypothetical protein
MFMLVADDHDRLTLRPVRPWHRLIARCQSTSLDRELAEGASPEECSYLAARAMQLTSWRSRRRLAAGVRKLLTPEARSVFGPAVPIRRTHVARAAAELGALPGHLLAPGPVPARGVAMVHQLLSDGGGPLYQGACREDIRDVAQRAATALTR